MEARQIPLVLALVACVAMLVAVPVVGVGVDGGQSPQVENNTTSSANETNDSFGGQVSAFMQASAVDANTTVESGMFDAAVNTSQSPEREVTSRAGRLERELQRLEDKAARLEAKRANGTLPDVAYTAQASAIRERLVNLQEQINGTETAAKRVGVNVSSLDRLRTQAANMTGPEVSALARNITDAPRGPPEGVPGNPPGDAGPPGNDSSPPDNTGPSGNIPDRQVRRGHRGTKPGHRVRQGRRETNQAPRMTPPGRGTKPEHLKPERRPTADRLRAVRTRRPTREPRPTRQMTHRAHREDLKCPAASATRTPSHSHRLTRSDPQTTHVGARRAGQQSNRPPVRRRVRFYVVTANVT
jgi:hypothetical protein